MDPRDGDLWSAVRSFFQPKPPPPPPPPPTADPCRNSKVPPYNPFSHIFSPPPSTMARVEENGSLMDFVNASSFGGLEEVCMPFLSQIQRPPTTAGVVGPSTKAPDQPKQKRQLGGRSGKNKNRKEPIKKVVVHAPADTSNCSDNWAWRKYGQKPIKGSPYPRGYYRCSTNKSCPARKLVEKNWVDPKLVIITYTDEHDHPLPTHKSVLSGSTRNKRSGASPSGHSPTTPLATSPMSQSVEEEDKDVARKSRVEELEIGGVVDDDDFMLMGNATVPLVASSLAALDDFDDADPFFSQLWNHSGDGATGGGSK